MLNRLPRVAVARTRSVLCAALTIVACSSTHAEGAQTWGTASHVLALGLPAVAAATAWSQDDRDGLWQLAGAVALAGAGSEVLAKAHPKDRPDHSGNDSFASTHAAVAFAAARYLDKRYDGAAQPLAYGAAALVALARVRAHKHDWVDVAAGSALGWVSAELTTQRRGLQVAVLPTGRSGITVVSGLRW